ncbi:uncharacterized protein N7484_006203 [Penicillium longicatenatum]|uniref:uncharacterized protein n=1 Tax=Penicillium longicatenatum TaxID=1561947 RepID=UPI00254854AE|nr:uncharacterized protein N7484_006203 [Penicillium longicatenatum]KAJ5643696.1 hypothetical protein N7484_006203 [Penicillium longicatenatum]
MSADEGGDPKSMAPVNGESHPESTATATPGKRKRSTQDENPAVEPASSASRESLDLHENLRTLVGLLLKHDTELQLLSCPFPTSGAKPRAKRAKTSGDQDTSNIQARVEAGRYNTLQEFLADIERASAAVIERNQNQANGASAEGAPVTEVVNRIAAFKKHMNSLVGQSFVNQTDVKAETPDDDDDDQLQSTASHIGPREDKQALTLFGGNQSHPKQLFSSLQKSVKVPLQSSESGAEKFVEVQEPLREGGLPNGITTTRVVPYNLESSAPKPRTFGEVFAPRSGLVPVEPRKRSNRSTVTWIDPFDLVLDYKNFSGDRSNTSLVPVPSGQWLQYGGVTSSPSYWSRVEKHHEDANVGSKYGDPALWTGDDSSLLQGVYSSFAPSFDSSGAVLQAESKGMVWWGQRGESRLRTLLSLTEDLPDEVDVEAIDNVDESTLNEMVDTLKPKDYTEYLASIEKTSDGPPESKEINDALAEVSHLLETLASYQNIRKNTIPSTSENDELPVPESDDPDTPSDAERATYENLRSKLVSIISSLPPYVVSKVNGDQLGELNISQKIIIDSPDWKGTMEKDDHTLHLERAAAIAAQANAANRASTPSSTRPSNFQAPHSAYNQRSFNANARLSQSQGAFQVPPQARQPSSTGSFTPPYVGSRAPSTPSQRPGYGSQYSQANNVPQFQRPTSNGYTPQPYTPRPTATSNGTPQRHNPNPSVSAQRYGQMNTPTQAYPNSAAAATYARSAAEQATTKSQPQPEARHSQEGSLTPGSKQNGTPIQS